MDSAELLNRVAENLSVRRAFGAAYERDGILIIPVALVAGGGGGGAETAKPVAEETQSTSELASGSGGGFGGLVLPTGAYVVRDENVRFVPAVDATVIALTSLSILRLLIRARGRSQRRRDITERARGLRHQRRAAA